jgi:hypothetical protein
MGEGEMTIEEAIQVLSLSWKGDNNCVEAAKLGLEALKRIQKIRAFSGPKDYLLMPGETLEVNNGISNRD